MRCRRRRRFAWLSCREGLSKANTNRKNVLHIITSCTHIIFSCSVAMTTLYHHICKPFISHPASVAFIPLQARTSVSNLPLKALYLVDISHVVLFFLLNVAAANAAVVRVLLFLFCVLNVLRLSSRYKTTNSSSRQRSYLVIAILELQRNTIHTMPLIRWSREPLSLENMPQMAPTSITNNLNPMSIRIHIPPNRSRDRIKKCWPSTSTRELGIGGVERCVTSGTGVDALGRVLVVFARVGAFGTLLAEDSELIGREDSAPFLVGLLVGHCCGGCCCC